MSGKKFERPGKPIAVAEEERWTVRESQVYHSRRDCPALTGSNRYGPAREYAGIVAMSGPKLSEQELMAGRQFAAKLASAGLQITDQKSESK